MKVAIVGSRTWASPGRAMDAVDAYVASLDVGDAVVSGGAFGVDTWAADSARSRGVHVLEFLPDFATYGRRAPLLRNETIARVCDRIVAFWNGKSTGTKHAIALAERAGKPVEVRRP